MIFYSALAFINGIFIGTSRATNGQLSSKLTSLKASLCNHLVGFLFLSLVVLALQDWKINIHTISLLSCLGGVCGALFVASSSYAFPRLGALNTAILVISGQMISAVLLDWQQNHSTSIILRGLGVIFVLLGVYLSRTAQIKKQKDSTQ
jgi:transporter family-2 protein